MTTHAHAHNVTDEADVQYYNRLTFHCTDVTIINIWVLCFASVVNLRKISLNASLGSGRESYIRDKCQGYNFAMLDIIRILLCTPVLICEETFPTQLVYVAYRINLCLDTTLIVKHFGSLFLTSG